MAKSVIKVTEIVKEKYGKLQTATNSCPGFDYGLDRGGMRTFYCYVSSYFTYKQLVALWGGSPFLKGPHSADELNLESKNSFGYYKPEFVKWLIQYAVPGSKDGVFAEKTAGLYRQNIKPLADIYFFVYQKLQKHPDEFKWLKAELEKQQPGYNEDHYFFMNPGYFAHRDNIDWFYRNGGDGGLNGNVVKTAVAWWVRRHIDGTAPLFYRGLVKLRQTYQ